MTCDAFKILSLSKYREVFLPRYRIGIELQPTRKRNEYDIAVASSKIGGHPDLPDDVS